VTATARGRADAVRNAQKVLDAASQVFAEAGAQASIEDVAARAGVGKATVYRCWETKDALLAAVAGARVAWFTERVREARARPDAWSAFRGLVATAAEEQARNALLTSGLGSLVETDGLAAQRAAYREALQELMERAKQQGPMRSDATAREVTVLFCGVARLLVEEQQSDPAVWLRYADLVCDAFRTCASAPTGDA
jgi:AcrR family transcriptional regulator